MQRNDTVKLGAVKQGGLFRFAYDSDNVCKRSFFIRNDGREIGYYRLDQFGNKTDLFFAREDILVILER